MLLSRNAILEEIKRGTIVIDPFEPKNLKTTSYDVTLGEWFFRERYSTERILVHNLFDEESTAEVWTGPHRAETIASLERRTGQKFKNISRSARVILIGPGETILGHTREFIGGREVCVAKMYARSSMGRNFIEVCKDAGWGDIGYINRWTMEITNNSRYFSIPLVVGTRVAQMVFYKVPPLDGGDYAKEKGKYQFSSDLRELKRSWRPQMMLPRMHLDWEVADIREKEKKELQKEAKKKQ